MRRVVLVSVFILACLVAGAASHVMLSAFYPATSVVTTSRLITIEGGGQRVSVDNEEYDVVGSEPLGGENESGFYRLNLTISEKTLMESPERGDFWAPAGAPASQGMLELIVPAEAYEKALSTGSPVTVSSHTTTETKPVDFVPIAAGIGVLVGALAAVFAAWYQKGWGEAASELMEHGFHDMTIRDVEIVGHMMQLKEFTIPDLMRLTKASKITVWRMVQKLVEKGLVRQTEKTKLASGGLGGRGKPSKVYVYVGGSSDERRS
ncbi:MAG: hypothetical protein QW567_03770 [Candidatus Hadarchaeales archaeon]